MPRSREIMALRSRGFSRILTAAPAQSKVSRLLTSTVPASSHSGIFVLTGGVLNPGQGDAETGFQFTTGETGTYSLSPDCTGRMEIDLNAPVPPGSGLSSGVIKLMLVVTDGGRAIHTVVAELTSPRDTKPTLVTTSNDAWKIDPEDNHDHHHE